MDTNILNVLLAPGGAIDMITNFLVAAYAVIAAYYIFTSAANAKALRLLGYDRAWFAWIPYLRYYALASATRDNEKSTGIFNRWNIPTPLYELWFVFLLLIQMLDGSNGDIFMVYMSVPAMILYFIVMAIFLGNSYAKIYARLTDKGQEECMTLGLWSGVLPIIAAIEFCAVKKKNIRKNKEEKEAAG